MKRPAYSGEGQSSPLPISWPRYMYTSGKNEAIDVNPEMAQGITVKDVVRSVQEDNPQLARKLWGDEPFELTNAIQKFVLQNYKGLTDEERELATAIRPCLPSDTLYINVDKEAVKRSGMKIPGDSIPDRMYISLADRDRVYKSFLMMLEMIGQANFSRPIYMSTTVGPSNYGNLYRHFVQEGIAWRITPFTFAENGPSSTVCDTEKMYDNMMNKYQYGNLKHPGLYIDETTMRMCYTHRRWFAVLITNLIAEGKKDKALKALDKCEKEIPAYNVPHDFNSSSLEIAQAYIDCGKVEKAMPILEAITTNAREYITWYLGLNNNYFANSRRYCHEKIYAFASVQNVYANLAKTSAANKAKYEKKSKALENELQVLYGAYTSKCDAAGIDIQ